MSQSQVGSADAARRTSSFKTEIPMLKFADHNTGMVLAADSSALRCASDNPVVPEIRALPRCKQTSRATSNALGKLKSTLDPRTFSIATFALCGFANVGSIGMQIGGIGALVPNRRNDLAALGLRAMLAGTMANLMSASIVSMLLK